MTIIKIHVEFENGRYASILTKVTAPNRNENLFYNAVFISKTNVIRTYYLGVTSLIIMKHNFGSLNLVHDVHWLFVFGDQCWL